MKEMSLQKYVTMGDRIMSQLMARTVKNLVLKLKY